jgi:hypothetical protein
MARLRTLATALATLALAAAILEGVPAFAAAFSSKTANEGDVVTAAKDFRAPVATAAVGKGIGGTVGFLKQSGTYFVYANVTDGGNPASGVATVKANVSGLTAGQTEVPLAAGSFSSGGVSYEYRSAQLTASAAPAEGPVSFQVTATDKAGNAGTIGGTVTMDGVQPKAADVQTANKAATVGLAEQNDTITYTFSEPIDPESIQAAWTGGATPVTVRINDNGLLGSGNDNLQVFNSANSAALPLGSVDLGRNDYAGGLLGGNYRFSASSMSISGATLTITLGKYESTIIIDAGRVTAGGAGTMVWTPAAGPYDLAGNALLSTTATESGAADKEF